jgi:hypothetical protein
MKKILNIVILLAYLLFFTACSYARTFEEGFAQVSRKPLAVLVYAQWSDGYQNALAQFRKSQQKLGNLYNFVELDIASKDTKAFNQRYNIQPRLPYVTTFTNMGKISRYIDSACTSSYDCLNTTLKGFIK